MLRVVANHGRLFAFVGDRKAGYFLQSNQKPGHPGLRNHCSAAKFGAFNSFRRLISHCRNCSRGNVASGRSSVKENFWNGTSSRTFYSVPFGPLFSPVGRIACTLSLALTRFHVIPGILALSVGELEWVQKTHADGHFFSAGNGLYIGAQDGRLYISSIFYSFIECVFLIFRAAYLAVLFFPAILMAPFADSFGVEFRKTWLLLVHGTLEQAGPAFIKWGQWAATRPDLFPNDLCTALSMLHSKAPAHSFTYSKNTIEKAFGRKLDEIFEQFEESPVASGSIAQVHQASLRFQHPGQRLSKPIPVAVKVRHPGVGESIKRDFTIINFVAKLSSYIPALNWLRLDESVRQFAVFMMSQVDLAREAANLSRFIYNFRRWKDVSFPKPFYPLVHPAVLVETFEPGDSVTHYIDGLGGNTRIKSDLAHIGTHALLKMLLVDNFIHADMHPGNILVRLPQRKRSRKRLFRPKPHIIFLDVGMTAELSKSDRRNLMEFFKAVALRDGRTAAECTLRLSRKQSCPDPKAFTEELERAFTFWGTPDGDVIHPVECMHHLLEQVRRYRVNVDGSICSVLVTILVLEGWQRKLDPDYDIMHTLRTLLLNPDGVQQPIDYFFS
ncbi:ABC1 family protein YPL109C, mitochondrial-like isoform X2 [Phalaenopsis equestris]|uniref:ABC1 family protein YPL109C, mitochondrial-like isoform X2 n=1 Tax=Phalaenopsis equestris TaxID=78828 RepID=UPI0009E49064|nr:ABC1 family protein YPL109C, mitochondrial-like isoform X2 [Phalaenopsis equestris]